MSVYPKKELPFFILFTAGLCSFTALLALLTHHYPEPMGYIARTVSHLLLSDFYPNFAIYVFCPQISLLHFLLSFTLKFSFLF